MRNRRGGHTEIFGSTACHLLQLFRKASETHFPEQLPFERIRMVRNGLRKQTQRDLRVEGRVRAERTEGNPQAGRIGRNHRQNRLISRERINRNFLAPLPLQTKKHAYLQRVIDSASANGLILGLEVFFTPPFKKDADGVFNGRGSVAQYNKREVYFFLIFGSIFYSFKPTHRKGAQEQ
jgi:hypothetical protein